MGKRGPKPTPLAILAKRGSTLVASRQDSPDLEPGLPTAPKHLADEAKKEWTRAGKLLLAARVMTPADLTVLASYCQCWAEYIEAIEQVEIEGSVVVSEKGGMYMSPWVAIRNTARRDMIKFAAELGLTPSSRARVQAVSQPAKSTTDDDEYFSKRTA